MTQNLRWTLAVLLLFVATTILPTDSSGQNLRKDALQRTDDVKASQLKLLGRSSALATSQLAEKIIYMWGDDEWLPETRTVHVYGELGRAASWDYMWHETDWMSTSVTRFTPFGNTFSESVVDIYDETTKEWAPSDKTVTDFLLEPVSGAPYVNWTLYQTWNGADWADHERDTYSYDSELRLTGGQTEVWDDAWTPYTRYTVEEVAGDVIMSFQEWIGGAWVNAERSIYSGWTIKELQKRLEQIGYEIGDYDGVMYGIQLLPAVVSQEWLGNEWRTVGRLSRFYDVFTGDIVNVQFDAWDEGNWIPEMRYYFTYSAAGVVATISNEISAGETWMPFALETYAYDDEGAISEVIQQIDLGEGMENAGRVVMKWNHLSSGAENDDLPGTFALDAAYPNPFNPATHLTYRLGAAGHVAIRVYDALGRQVATLADGILPAGSHDVTFEGSHLPSGQYIVRMEAEGFTQARVVTLLK